MSRRYTGQLRLWISVLFVMCWYIVLHQVRISIYSPAPEQLFSATSSTSEQDHNRWIDTIRGMVGERVLAKEDRMPSTTALRRHWDRRVHRLLPHWPATPKKPNGCKI